MEEGVFYEMLRDLVVAVVTGIVLFIASFTLWYRFSLFRKSSFAGLWEVQECDDDSPAPASVVFVFEAASLASCLGLVLLITFTVLFGPLIPTLNSTRYGSWLGTSMLDLLWCFAVGAGYFIVFVMLPFAYFYSETDSSERFLRRVNESAVTLSLVYALFSFASVLTLLIIVDETQKQHFYAWLVQLFTGIARFLSFETFAASSQNLNDFSQGVIRSLFSYLDIFSTQASFIPLHQSGSAPLPRIISFFSLFKVEGMEAYRFNWPLTAVLHVAMCCWYTVALPRGISNLFALIRTIPVSLNYQSKLLLQIEQLDFEINHLRSKLESAAKEQSDDDSCVDQHVVTDAKFTPVKSRSFGSLESFFGDRELFDKVRTKSGNGRSNHAQVLPKPSFTRHGEVQRYRDLLSAAVTARRACKSSLAFSSPWLRNFFFLVLGSFSVLLWLYILYQLSLTVISEHSAPLSFPAIQLSLHVPRFIESTDYFQRWKTLALVIVRCLHALLNFGILGLLIVGAAHIVVERRPSISNSSKRGVAEPDGKFFSQIPQSTPSKTPLFKKVFGAVPSLSTSLIRSPLKALNSASDCPGAAVSQDWLGGAKVGQKRYVLKLSTRRVLALLFLLNGSLLAYPEIAENILGISSTVGLIPFATTFSVSKPPLIRWACQLYRIVILCLVVICGLKGGLKSH